MIMNFFWSLLRKDQTRQYFSFLGEWPFKRKWYRLPAESLSTSDFSIFSSFSRKLRDEYKPSTNGFAPFLSTKLHALQIRAADVNPNHQLKLRYVLSLYFTNHSHAFSTLLASVRCLSQRQSQLKNLASSRARLMPPTSGEANIYF